MTALGGRLEGTVTVPVGGWDVSANAGAGSFTATVPAGDYFVDDLAYELEDQLNAGAGGVWTVTVADTDLTGTGKYSISNTSVWSLTWTDTDLRDALGFTANYASIGAGQSRTGDNVPSASWIPDCPKWTPYGDAKYDRHSDLRQSVAPSGGAVKTLVGNTYDYLEGVRWDMVGNARAVGLDVAGSWQHFWSTIMTGRFSYIRPGKPVRISWNADGTAGQNSVNLIVPPRSSIEPVVSGWTGLYRVVIPMILKVS